MVIFREKWRFNVMKRILCLVMVAMAFSFAQDEPYVRNICDTLGAKEVTLQLQQIEETLWYGSKDLSNSDSVKKTVFKDYQDVKPLNGKFTEKLPVSIKASCVESRNQLFQYATWSIDKWSFVNNDSGYATMIMDVNQYQFPGFDATNSFNVLAIRKGSLPENNSYSSKELMVSRTFELNFDWWYSLALYYRGLKFSYTAVVAMDSLSAVKSSIQSLNIPDSISKVQLQIFHVVLTDPNKNQPVSSSSEESSSSSVASSSSEKSVSSSSYSGAGPWNCGDNPLLSCSSTYYGSSSSTSKENSSSSYVQTSSSEQESSSSEEQSTIIGRLGVAPRVFNGPREVRRLDGSKVKAGESLTPGVYYVKGLDGRWKKQVELP